jgi:hypothetical protein
VEEIDVAHEIFIVNRANWSVVKAMERLEMELLGIDKRQESKDLWSSIISSHPKCLNSRHASSSFLLVLDPGAASSVVSGSRKRKT